MTADGIELINRELWNCIQLFTCSASFPFHGHLCSGWTEVPQEDCPTNKSSFQWDVFKSYPTNRSSFQWDVFKSYPTNRSSLQFKLMVLQYRWTAVTGCRKSCSATNELCRHTAPLVDQLQDLETVLCTSFHSAFVVVVCFLINLIMSCNVYYLIASLLLSFRNSLEQG